MARRKWRQNRNYAHVHFRIQSDTKPFEYAACGRENFRIRKKIFAEKKISGYVWTWPEILGKQNSLFPSGPVIKCLLLPVWNRRERKYWKPWHRQTRTSQWENWKTATNSWIGRVILSSSKGLKLCKNINIWKNYHTLADEERNNEDIPIEHLNLHMSRFFMEIKKKDDVRYEPTTLTSFHHSVNDNWTTIFQPCQCPQRPAVRLLPRGLLLEKEAVITRFWKWKSSTKLLAL